MLENGNFSNGWQDMPPTEHHLTNQKPNGWKLEWLPIGASLFGDQARARGIPECVHKLAGQLPPDEQRGGKYALILEGTAVYKIFHGGAAFGAMLSQNVTGLEAGTIATLSVPIQVHTHDDGDVWGAESGVWVNGAGYWRHSGVMGNRKWYTHKLRFVVPESGEAKVVICVKSKWARPKDFFIDGIALEAEKADSGQPPAIEPPMADPPSHESIVISVPSGYSIRQYDGKKAAFIEIYPNNNNKKRTL